MSGECRLIVSCRLACGLASAGFIALHRHIVLFLRRNQLMKTLFQKK